MDIAAWLAEQIEEHSPQKDPETTAATRLAEAYAALAGANTQAFGIAVPPELANKDKLRQRALELLKMHLATMDAEHKEKVKLQLAGYGIGPQPAPSHDLPPEPKEG
ncbi:MAG: hypothetical protein ACKV2T_34765 [Kofleriaceae bacterium]